LLQTIDYDELLDISRELDAEKPYLEIIDGVEVPRVSPQLRHSLLEIEFLAVLREWARERGGTLAHEWRFWIVPAGERKTSLVPDVAYLSSERADTLDDLQLEAPPLSPDIAIEIRSPGESERNIQRKTEMYLANGTKLVLDVDPKSRSIIAHDGVRVRTFTEADRFEHPAAPGLTFEVVALFDAAERNRRLP
jgi:Uma2 family endonuclease